MSKLYYWLALLLTNPISIVWITHFIPLNPYGKHALPLVLTFLTIWVLSIMSTCMNVRILGGGKYVDAMNPWNK
jgi:hypothetical protein